MISKEGFHFFSSRKVVYVNLRSLWEKHACSDHLLVIKDLEAHCGYSPNRIPQLEEVNNFLKSKIGEAAQ